MKIMHAAVFHRATGEASRRMQFASDSWAALREADDGIIASFKDEGEFAMNAKSMYDDKRALPFVRDVFAAFDAEAVRAGADAWMYTNSDVALVPETGQVIRELLETCQYGFAHRYDIRAFWSFLNRNQLLAGAFDKHPGADLFWFRTGSWSRFAYSCGWVDRPKAPMCCLAVEGWDFWVKMEMLEAGFVDDGRSDGLCYHEYHSESWANGVLAGPAQLASRANLRDWALYTGRSQYLDVVRPYLFGPTPNRIPVEPRRKNDQHDFGNITFYSGN